jgi:hypothetical protein
MDKYTYQLADKYYFRNTYNIADNNRYNYRHSADSHFYPDDHGDLYRYGNVYQYNDRDVNPEHDRDADVYFHRNGYLYIVHGPYFDRLSITIVHRHGFAVCKPNPGSEPKFHIDLNKDNNSKHYSDSHSNLYSCLYFNPHRNAIGNRQTDPYDHCNHRRGRNCVRNQGCRYLSKPCVCYAKYVLCEFKYIPHAAVCNDEDIHSGIQGHKKHRMDYRDKKRG